MSENPFAEKTYLVGDKSYTLRPLSFFELLDLPELVTKIIESLPEGRDATPLEITHAAKDKITALLTRCLGIEPGDLREIPFRIGMQILADFMEMNLNENFSEALKRAVAAGKRIYSSSFNA